MVPTQQDSRFCLLLLLGLVGMVSAFHGAPSNLTPEQKFVVKHINRSSSHCNIAMQRVNRRTADDPNNITCLGKNSFLGTTLDIVINVCNKRNVTCLDGRFNCHRSSSKVKVTDCDLTRSSSDYRQCQYNKSSTKKYYIVACNPRKHPVHLDEVFTL